jgi:hypothetical protein
MPIDGIKTNPASIDPTAAPIVLTKYSVPLSAAGRSDDRENHRIAIGNVAPSASAGSITITMQLSTRTSGKSGPAPFS